MTMHPKVSPFALLLVSLLVAAACGGGRAPADPSATPVRMAAPDPVVTCAEWVERAVGRGGWRVTVHDACDGR
jgi:hypothetical protein